MTHTSSLRAARAALHMNRGLPVAAGAALAMAATLAGAAPIAAKPPGTQDGTPYSRPTNTNRPQHVLWGDLHVHTDNSIDAGLFGTKLGPEDAYRFARGEQVVSTTGVPARLRRPYDFLAVTDHSDYMGVPLALRDGAPELLADPIGKKWYQAFHAPDAARLALFSKFAKDFAAGKPTLHAPGIARAAWNLSVAAADKYNEPGRFTALIGFEWSAGASGDNLHRNIIFRDDADRALRVLPLFAFGDPDPQHLFTYLAGYEHDTGGQILAIPHNSDLSGGLMFTDKTLAGKPIDRSYAEARAKWEPVAEITQTKGDSETDPSVSPDDEFANFERWDKANIGHTKLNQPEEQPYNYLRPTLTRGLKLEQALGANPFKYGLIGSTDTHTALSSADADNYFNVTPTGEPGPNRLKLASTTPTSSITGDKKEAASNTGAAAKPAAPPIPVPGLLDMTSSGLAAVWATENTRAAIFDALRRKEVYATTGPRITVRVFGGWRFKPGDETRSDFADNGYANGVPMGGDLSSAPAGASPTFLIQTAKDPDGANLDRAQMIKGWVDRIGTTHEKIFDVAWSGARAPGGDGKLPLVGNSVDIAHATYSNSIGAPVLATAWTDPEFDATLRAYYYVRVIEIPTPRWTTYDAARFGGAPPKGLPTTVTQRAYTSPIWYVPPPAGAG